MQLDDMIQVEEKYDIMDLYRVSNGRTMRVNSWEFIDRVNDAFESGGFKEFWHTLRFIVGDGTDSSVQFVILAEGGEFYPEND